MQTAIPCLFMRGGTSRGPFFLESDLSADVPTRDRVLLAALGSPDKRQIDGLGGANPLTSTRIITSGTRKRRREPRGHRRATSADVIRRLDALINEKTVVGDRYNEARMSEIDTDNF